MLKQARDQSSIYHTEIIARYAEARCMQRNVMSPVTDVPEPSQVTVSRYFRRLALREA